MCVGIGMSVWVCGYRHVSMGMHSLGCDLQPLPQGYYLVQEIKEEVTRGRVTNLGAFIA